jgi:hypothetical protein
MTRTRKPSPDSGGGDDQHVAAFSHTRSSGRWGDPRFYDAAKAPLAVLAIAALVVGVVVATHAAREAQRTAEPSNRSLPYRTTPGSQDTGESAFPAPADKAARPTEGSTADPQPHRSDVSGPSLSDDAPVEGDEPAPVNCLSTGDGLCGPEWKKPRADVLGALDVHGVCLWLPKKTTGKMRERTDITWVICEDGYVTKVE